MKVNDRVGYREVGRYPIMATIYALGNSPNCYWIIDDSEEVYFVTSGETLKPVVRIKGV